MNLGSSELIIVLIIVLLVFGGSQLPKLAKNLGKAQKEFKEGLDAGMKDDEQQGSAQQQTAQDAESKQD